MHRDEIEKSVDEMLAGWFNGERHDVDRKDIIELVMKHSAVAAEAAEAEVKRLRDGLLKIRDGYGPNHMSAFCRDTSRQALASTGGEHHAE